MNNFLTKTLSPVSCIYFFFVGKVKDIRKKYQIDQDLEDNLMVCKYGYTENLNRRVKEHKRKFGNQLELLAFNLIDASYLSEAENSLYKYFKEIKSFINLKIDSNKQNEIVAVDQHQIKNIKHQIGLIGSKYEGKASKQSEFVKDLIVKYEKEITKERHEKEIMIERHEKEIIKKDNELLKQKIEIMELKTSIKTQ